MHVYVKRSLQACVHHMTLQIGFKPQDMSRGPSVRGAHGPVIRAIFKFFFFFLQLVVPKPLIIALHCSVILTQTLPVNTLAAEADPSAFRGNSFDLGKCTIQHPRPALSKIVLVPIVDKKKKDGSCHSTSDLFFFHVQFNDSVYCASSYD